jgi:hypothetical protein
VVEASDQLLKPAYALSTTCWAAICVVVKVFLVKCYLKTSPLTFGEQITEVGLADVAHLIGADTLHGIGVVNIKGKPGRGVLLHACSGVLQIDREVGQQVKVSKITDCRIVVVEATVIGRQCVVFSAAFWNDDHIEGSSEVGQLWVWRDLETITEETQSPVDLAVPDSRLARRSQDRLWSRRAIREACIVGELRNAGVVEGTAISIVDQMSAWERGD